MPIRQPLFERSSATNPMQHPIKRRALLVVTAIALVVLITQSMGLASAPVSARLPDYDTQNLRWLESRYPALYAQIKQLSWVTDGLSDMEKTNLDEMLYIGVRDYYAMRRNLPTLAALIPMSFLEVADTTDALALRAIRTLSGRDQLAPLVEHPTFLGGIDDDETTLIVAAATVGRHPDKVTDVLTPGHVSIETTVSEEGTRFSIVRPSTTASTAETAGVLEAAAELFETTMDRPLPTDHVILVLYDGAYPEGYEGANFGFAISYNPEREQPGNRWSWWNFRKGLAHEVAHYFWRGNENWIDEGLATAFEQTYGLSIGLSSGQLEEHRRDCEVHNLEALSAGPPEQGGSQFHCNYYLGSRLFNDLRGAMGEVAFNEGLRDLYALTRTEQEARRKPGIDEVRQAFDAQAEIVERHWSGGLNAPENRPYDEGIDRTTHDLIQWDDHPTYDSESGAVTMNGTLREDAVLTNIHLGTESYASFTLSPADGRDYLGSILPLRSGFSWHLDDPGDVVASVYHLSGREFSVAFQFPLEGNPEDFVVIVWGFRDEQRVPSISARDDRLGYARIRIPPSIPEFASATMERAVAENTGAATNIGDPVAATDGDGDALTYALGGADAAAFAIDETTGQLSTKAALDYEAKQSYQVTVTATDPGGLSATVNVTIKVTNVDEDGVVDLSPAQASAGTTLTASLSDPDGGVTGVSWQWQRSDSSQGAFTDIAAATAAGYTPATADIGMYLQAKATYTDNHGADKVATSSAVMVEDRMPAFDAQAMVPNQSWAVGEDVGTVMLPAASGGDGDLVYTITPALPAGLTFDAAARTITGTTEAAMVRTEFTYTVTDTDGDDDTLTFHIEVVVASTGGTLLERYDTNGNGEIERSEVIAAINDYLFGTGDDALSRAEVIEVINLYIFG